MNVNVPSVVGVPDKFPVDESIASPEGTLPLADHVMGFVPVAVNCAL